MAKSATVGEDDIARSGRMGRVFTNTSTSGRMHTAPLPYIIRFSRTHQKLFA